MSSKNKDIVWPPQTTQDVLNLTPRKNRPQQQSRPSAPPSPSPMRRSAQPPQLDGSGSTDEESTDEDEEMLKLKLQRIEAKLKLKKLQKQQQKRAATTTTTAAAPPPAPPAVEVPLSPAARRQIASPTSPKSPSRVLLGIDRGLTGKDVSLRRAPQYRKPPGQTTVRAPSPQRPIKTFSQRLAEERSRERNVFEKHVEIAKTRSKGFGLESGGGGAGAGVPVAPAQQATTSFTTLLTRSSTVPSFTFSAAPPPPPQDRDDSTDEAGFDSFSGLHLLRRTTPHPTVTRHLAGKQVFQLPQLLKTVVSPSYEPPDVKGDWVVVGTICSKSDPRSVGQNTGAKETGKKYMVMQLTDLKWELELFLFGAGFDRFRKLPVGTVVALLNPGVMRPRNKDSGRFSLTIADDAEDCMLEIGVARDLGFCRSVKRDGATCNAWIDKRHTHFCAFHVEQTVKKARVSRAEVNSMTSLFSPPKKGSLKPRKFFGRGGGRSGGRDDGLLQEGPISDIPQRLGGAGGSIFVAPGRSTAQLLDDEDYLAGTFHRGTSREERLHRRIEAGKKERELTKRIIEAQGREGGLGAQYLRTRIKDTEEGEEKEEAREKERTERKQLSEALAGLRTGRASKDVRLSPVKRKRAMTGPAGVVKKTRFADEEDDDDDGLDIVR